jgi:hypothetical protein
MGFMLWIELSLGFLVWDFEVGSLKWFTVKGGSVGYDSDAMIYELAWIPSLAEPSNSQLHLQFDVQILECLVFPGLLLNLPFNFLEVTNRRIFQTKWPSPELVLC